MQLDLSGRHALVCGASRGIGRACALELAQLGARITALSRSADKLAGVVAELPAPADGSQHASLAVDMADTEPLAQQLEQHVADDPVHILINNTGGPPGGPLAEAGADAMMDAYRQHLIAGQTLLQAVLPGMREAGFGRLVNIVSTSVKEPIAGLGVSNTTRAAVAGWAKTLSGELAADGITVNNVLPGYTRTDRLAGIIRNKAQKADSSEDEAAAGMLAGVPAGRFGEAHEVAATAAFLCTPAAGYINGVSIPVDGGRTRSLT